jgi:4'-phosphopantetheinyl transferase EntD
MASLLLEAVLETDSRLVSGGNIRNVRASRLLGRLFSARVIAFEARQPLGPETLRTEEARYIARAVPKRVGEFAAGRACARRALAQLAITDFPLRVGADREPLWPEGITGSITHTAGFCGVVVARKTGVLALGIDAELASAVHPGLWRQIATAEELRWLAGLPGSRAATMASVVFSAKEAFFKCQFPLTREWLNFADVTVHVERRALRIAPCRALALEALVPGPWSGRYALEDALVVTGVSLPAGAASVSNSAARAGSTPHRL